MPASARWAEFCPAQKGQRIYLVESLFMTYRGDANVTVPDVHRHRNPYMMRVAHRDLRDLFIGFLLEAR